MSFAVMTDVELADWSLGVGVVVGLTTTAWVEDEVVGRDGGAVITDTGRIVICGSAAAFAGAVPGLDGEFPDVLEVLATFGLGFFAAGVVEAAAVWAALDGGV
jgi:hypothetical protein